MSYTALGLHSAVLPQDLPVSWAQRMGYTPQSIVSRRSLEFPQRVLQFQPATNMQDSVAISVPCRLMRR